MYCNRELSRRKTPKTAFGGEFFDANMYFKNNHNNNCLTLTAQFTHRSSRNHEPLSLKV